METASHTTYLFYHMLVHLVRHLSICSTICVSILLGICPFCCASVHFVMHLSILSGICDNPFCSLSNSPSVHPTVNLQTHDYDYRLAIDSQSLTFGDKFEERQIVIEYSISCNILAIISFDNFPSAIIVLRETDPIATMEKPFVQHKAKEHQYHTPHGLPFVRWMRNVNDGFFSVRGNCKRT